MQVGNMLLEGENNTLIVTKVFKKEIQDLADIDYMDAT